MTIAHVSYGPTERALFPWALFERVMLKLRVPLNKQTSSARDAEAYHQDHLRLNPEAPYIVISDLP